MQTTELFRTIQIINGNVLIQADISKDGVEFRVRDESIMQHEYSEKIANKNIPQILEAFEILIPEVMAISESLRSQ